MLVCRQSATSQSVIFSAPLRTSVSLMDIMSLMFSCAIAADIVIVSVSQRWNRKTRNGKMKFWIVLGVDNVLLFDRYCTVGHRLLNVYKSRGWFGVQFIDQILSYSVFIGSQGDKWRQLFLSGCYGGCVGLSLEGGHELVSQLLGVPVTPADVVLQ